MAYLITCVIECAATWTFYFIIYSLSGNFGKMPCILHLISLARVIELCLQTFPYHIFLIIQFLLRVCSLTCICFCIILLPNLLIIEEFAWHPLLLLSHTILASQCNPLHFE
eukprot:NODE_1237_length_1664_cov_0.808307.p3 type:complete len:111 gc:universal NODE_1237_length_1664_cov_0.808307:712-380(-)